MNKKDNRISKFIIIEDIILELYETGGYIYKNMESNLLKYTEEELKIFLNEVKLNGFFDEDKKRD